MTRFDTCRLTTLVTLTVAILTLLPVSAQALTQRDWMTALVDSLGRSFGLPDQPQTDDYLSILQGKRNLRYEAETVHAEDDEVSTLAFLNYGPFSGPGWLLGISKPSEVHLRFTLPLDGRYRLSLAVRTPGHVVQVGGQRFTVDGDAQRFIKVDAGEVTLTAGLQEIVVTLPPGGAFDYLELAAPNLPPITPDGGWQPDTPLTWDILAVTAVQALGLEKNLPLSGQSQEIEAESLAETGGTRVVEDAHLGRPSGGRWLRTSAQPAEVIVPLNIVQGGFHDLELTLMGQPVKVLVNSHLELAAAGKPYLDTVTLPPVFLSRGANRLAVTLPPGGGIDRIVVKSRQSDLTALSAALGMTATGAAPTSVDLDRLTNRLATAIR